MRDTREKEERAGQASAKEKRFAEAAAPHAPTDEWEEDECDDESDHRGQRKSVRPFNSRVATKA